MADPGSRWELVDRFAELRSRWVTLIGEHLRTESGAVLEYWRVERASSAIVLTVHRGALLLPPAVWRPGVGQATLDFAGGRLAEGMEPSAQVPAILSRELGVAADDIDRLTPLNPGGWAVDSSFSSQRVHGFVAELRDGARPKAEVEQVALDGASLEALLRRLECLQCRAVLREWQSRGGGLQP